MLHYLKLIYTATTVLFSPSIPSNIDHLLSQIGPLEKTECTIEHVIKKAEYNEKNPWHDEIFDIPLPFAGFPHSCKQECANSFASIKQLIPQLHLAVAQNRFKTVFALLFQHPKLCEFLDSENNTVLHMAVSGKHALLTLALLCHCPRLITYQNKQEKTPAHMALKGNPKKVLLLVKAAYASK